MLSERKIALSAMIVLSTTFSTSAATKHHRVTRVQPEIYHMVPGISGDACSPIHAPFCRNICTGLAPCAPLRNY
jgi:hypothetical protein